MRRGEFLRMGAAGAAAPVVLPFLPPPLLDHNRVSLGNGAEMARWAELLRGFREKGWV